LDISGLRFEVGRSYSEDLLFSIQVTHSANKIVTVPGAVYYYKKRSGSAMKSKNPEIKRKRKKEALSGQAVKKELIRKYGLTDGVMGIHAVHEFRYKILGIPVAEKKIFNDNTTRWYLFGLCVMQIK
jgi:hypothetical protein